MKWTRIRIKTITDAEDIIISELYDLGLEGAQIEDKIPLSAWEKEQMFVDIPPQAEEDDGIAYLSFFVEEDSDVDIEDMISQVKDALEEMRNWCDIGEGSITVDETEDIDWINNWKQYFKPLTVGDKLVIKPSWEEYNKSDDRIILEIDPASSFGTGQHNTTQLCLELIEKNLNKGDRLLDLGCGSGILSIASILLGAEEVTAVDIDQNSVKIAKENAEKNNIAAEKYTAYCGNVIDDNELVEKIGGKYDVIAANIVADVLIAMSPLFDKFVKKGGTLILSGIISERCHEVIDAVKAKGYTLVEQREANDWVAVSFKA